MPGEDVISQPGGAGGSYESAGRQSTDRHAPGFEPTQDEQTVVGQWLARVTRAESNPPMKEWADQLEELRGYLAGTKHDDKTKEQLVRTNMIFATIAAMIPELYARNPVIAVTPTDAVPGARMGMVKKFAATAEKVIRKMLVEEGKLKKRAKANIRAACATSYGVLKVSYQKEYRGDAVLVRRVNDTQDNLAKVEGLIARMKKGDDPAVLAQQRDEIKANLAALAADKELEIYKGFVIDRMKSEDFLILDENIDEFDEYEEARALGHKIWMTVGQARQLFDCEMYAATRYGRPRAKDEKKDDTPVDEQFVCVVEIWDKENGVIRTTAKGMNRWLREPYAPRHASQRWYPFFVLGFNLIEGRWRPISDVELLKGLQNEYNTTRTNYADVREKAAPKTVIRKGGNLTETDVHNLQTSGNKEWVAVEGNPQQPISHDIHRLDGPTIDPAAYDVTMIRNDMDMVAGRSDASRANLIKPKTATEAEIMAEAMQSRVGERRDTHEDLLSEMGEAALEIALADLTKDEVRQLAGDEAEWPDTPQTVKEIFSMVSVRVRAGSSGKPNSQKLREQWLQLLPIVKETMVGVMELRAAGNLDMAQATLELLRETLERFEETLDVDAIIPPMEENGIGQQMQQMAQELAAFKEQGIAMEEELGKTKEELAKAQQAEQAKAIEAQAKADADMAEQARRDRESEHKMKLETEEMQRRERLEIDKGEREERMTNRKLEAETTARSEIERIRAGATSEDNQRKAQEKQQLAMADEKRMGIEDRMMQMMDLLEQTIVAVNNLAQEVKDNTEADRVPEWGADGMPTRVTLKKKTKPKEAMQ